MESVKGFVSGHCYRCHGVYDHIHGIKTQKPEAFDFIGVFMGHEEGFECIICDKGHNAWGFNVYQGRLEHPTKAEVEDYISDVGYETFTFGKEHLPEMVEEIL